MNDQAVVQTSEKMGGIHGNFDLLKVLLAYIIIVRHIAQAFLPSDSIFTALICGGISTAGVPIYFITVRVSVLFQAVFDDAAEASAASDL